MNTQTKKAKTATQIRPSYVCLVVLVITVAALTYMEFSRRGAQKDLAKLQADVQTASQKAVALRAREARLAVHRPLRTDLIERMLVPQDGNHGGQLIDALRQASKASGTRLGPLRLTGELTTGGTPGLGFATHVTGSEQQVLTFLKAVEEGRPLVSFTKVQWHVPISADGGSSGSVQLEGILYGPLNLSSKKNA